MAKDKDGVVLVSVSGKWISYSHTAMAYCAFFSALIVGMYLHFHKIVKNEHYGYPDEWFPSVSATIGDRYPERSIFQLFIAITSGPRFALVFLWYMMTRRPGAFAPKFVASIGLIRTVFCGGWVYITSTDDHDWHDIFMISYLVFTLPWTIGCLALSPMNREAVKYRKILAGLFFGTLVPLVYFFIQHKVHKVAGAYTIYAFFEWSLILFDVGFDAITAWDFESFEFRVVDTKGVSKGNGVALADTVLEKSNRDRMSIPQQLIGGKYSWDEMIDAAADIYTGFMFWSILTSLGVTIWYFPLWHMGISGYEILIMTTCSPFLLGIPSVRRWVVGSPRQVYIASLLGLAAFIAKEPTPRLLAVGAGVSLSCLAWAGSFWAERNNSARLEAKVTAFSLGLLASSIAKFANHTNNPVWPIMNGINGGWNKIGLLLGVLAVLRSTRRTPNGSAELPSTHSQEKPAGSAMLPAIGLGGLLFGLHSLLSDSSTMITWVWDGYPIKGPLAAPHGAYTIAAMGIGASIGLFKPSVAEAWSFYGVATISAAIFYANAGWFGYYGALILTVYLTAITPAFITAATRHSPGKTFGLAFMFYNIIVLAHVWVVAYAFVPGGPLLRERTDIVMTLMMISLGCGVFGVTTTGPASKSKFDGNNAPYRKRSRSYPVYVLIALQLISVSVGYLRFPTFDYQPYHPKEKIVTAGIWTVHFALDNDMWSSERRMRDAIKELEIDVIGLLESDLQRIIMGNRDMTQFLAEDLGMYVDFGPGPNKHTWGAALLSKFPIVNSTHHLLPSPVGELAPAILATLDMYGEMVDVLVFHSGQEEDEEDRRLQSLGIQELMAGSPRPLILLSYLVTNPKEGNYNTYVSEKSRMRDIDPTDWDRWCEYILYRGLRRIGYARVSRGTITDTEIQLGKFVVGEPESSDEQIPESKIPMGYRFPEKFKGEGVRGHQYHVFDQPRYYL
ncbi:Frag1/DRAM/Sfk1 family-domain-containing protein [Geopyxis carbonaria]|nr:Frag1/DRAM/Sfk1 family-domain-containing protein [Geopyxis carbonaria]